MRPFALHGSLISLLRQFWSNEANITEPTLRRYVWRKNEEESGIRIGDLTEYAMNFAQKRPAVIAKLGRLQKKRVAVADRVNQYAARLSLSPDDVRIKFWTGDETLYCFGESAMQTRFLAHQVHSYLDSMSDVIAHAFCCLEWGVEGIDELGILKEANDTFVIPLVIRFEYESVWAVFHDGPPIRKIHLRNQLRQHGNS
jgi:hypothetical protein